MTRLGGLLLTASKTMETVLGVPAIFPHPAMLCILDTAVTDETTTDSLFRHTHTLEFTVFLAFLAVTSLTFDIAWTFMASATKCACHALVTPQAPSLS